MSDTITITCPLDGDTVNTTFNVKGTYTTERGNLYVRCTILYPPPGSASVTTGPTQTASPWSLPFTNLSGDTSGNVVLGAALLESPTMPPLSSYGPVHIKIASGGKTCS